MTAPTLSPGEREEEARDDGRLRDYLSRLCRLTERVASSLHLPGVLQEIVEAACELTGARYGALAVFDSTGRVQEFATHGVTAAQRRRIGALPEGRGILGWLYGAPAPLRLADLTRHPAAAGFPPHHPHMKTFLGVPVRHDGEARGSLYLTEKGGGREFTEEDEYLLTLFAAHAALAIQNAQRFEAQQKARAEAEAARQALAKSEADYRRLAEDAQDVIYRYRLRPTRGFDYVSPAAADLTGYTPEEHYADPDLGLKLIHPDDRALLQGLFDTPSAALAEPIVLRWVRKDGGVVWTEQRNVPVCDEQGNIVAIEGIARDITARRRAEAWRRLLEAAVEEAPDGVQVANLDGRVLYSNRAVEGIFGFSRDELTGRHVNEMNADPEFAGSVIIPTIRETGHWDGELTVKHKDGRLFPIWLTTSLVTDREGKPLAMVGVIRDITERKRAEEELARREATHRALLEAIPDLMFRISRDGVYLDFKAARGFEPLVPASQFLGQKMEQVVPAELAERSLKYLHQALETGETQVFEYQLPANGTMRDFEARMIVSGPDDVIAIIRDITDRKRAEEEVEKLRREFLGMVTHELKTPLTAIKGSAATALGSLRTLDPAEAQELFQIVDEQADRLRDLVDNLLDMTRIEAGSLSVSVEPTDLRAVLEGARSVFLRGGGSHDIRIRAPAHLPPVNADRRRVTQVLANLLGNAAKFSTASAPITIAVEHDPVQVTVHVQDSGRGIPREKLGYLFKKFSQVHEDAPRRLSGTGLGLAICKGIVEAHGGRIWAESLGEGQGATFSFTLPLADPPALAKLPAEASPTPRDHRARRPRVLAVDDEPEILRYVRRALEAGGYQPIVSQDPAHTSQLVELERPDVVLLDLRFPRASGLDLLRRIREFSDVPVIFLTASDSEEDTVRALKAGADDYMTKPFSPSELVARIEVALRRQALSAVPEARPPFIVGDLAVHFAERRVSVAGRPVSLSATEYRLLCELATHAGRVLTHDQILQRVWGDAYSGETELVRVFIRNLRRKLSDDARNPRYIFTEPQVGYRLARPPA